MLVRPRDFPAVINALSVGFLPTFSNATKTKKKRTRREIKKIKTNRIKKKKETKEMNQKMKVSPKMKEIKTKIHNQMREKIIQKKRNNPLDKDNYLLSKFKVSWMR